jgi:sugar lactone lactonase YvrE
MSYSVFASGASGYSIVSDNSNYLYVSDNSNNRVAKVSPTGTITTLTTITGLSTITFNGNKTTLYGVTYVDTNLYSIDPNTGATTVVLTGLHTDLNTSGTPPSFCADKGNHLYYTDNSGTNAIYQIDISNPSSPTQSLFCTLPAGTGLTAGLAVDAAENLYVCDNQYGNIIKITNGGTVINNTFITGLGGTLTVTVNTNGDLWIVDVNNVAFSFNIVKYTSTTGSVIANPYISFPGEPIFGGTFDTNDNFYFTALQTGIIYTTGGGGGGGLCFNEGSKLLCLVDEKDVHVPIEHIRPGTLVKTYVHGYKPVALIGSSKRYNPGDRIGSLDRLYICKKEAYPELTEDLILTGAHSILVDKLTEDQKEKTKEFLGQLFMTDRKFRLMAAIDSRAEPYDKEGMYNLWHLALEHENRYMNYGIYANGLLVETASKRMMSELSGMKLLE